MLNKNKKDTVTITKKDKEKIPQEIENLIANPSSTMAQIIGAVCDAIDPRGERGKILFFPLSSWKNPCLTAGTLFDVVKLIKKSIIPTIELSDDIQNATVFLEKLQDIKIRLPKNDENSQNCLDAMINDLNKSIQKINSNKNDLYTDSNSNNDNNALKITSDAYNELLKNVTNPSISIEEKTSTCTDAINLILNQTMPAYGLDAILMLINVSLMPQINNANDGQVLNNKLAELYGTKEILISEKAKEMLLNMTTKLAEKIQSLYNIDDDKSINNPQRTNYRF